MIMIAVLFLVPIYYLARSKGRNAAAYALAAAVLAVLPAWVPLFAAVSHPLLGLLQLILPALLLAFVALLKTKPGAPGKDYLRITFACPECGKRIAFAREREGAAELCPECGELITVATDQYSPSSPPKIRVKPDVETGEVCFERFGRREPAYRLSAVLNEAGVPARVAGNDGGVLVYLAATQGFRVMINAVDWDTAVEIDKRAKESPPPPSGREDDDPPLPDAETAG